MFIVSGSKNSNNFRLNLFFIEKKNLCNKKFIELKEVEKSFIFILSLCEVLMEFF